MKNTKANAFITLNSLSKLTARPSYTPEKIQRLMRKLNLNERGLAVILNVSPYTIRLWLKGKMNPCNPSSRLLQLLELDAGIVSRLAAGTDNI